MLAPAGEQKASCRNRAFDLAGCWGVSLITGPMEVIRDTPWRSGYHAAMISLFEKKASRLVIRDVALLDPRDGSVAPHRDLLLNGGFVAAIAGPGEISVELTHGAQILDARGYYALPGLIDSHLHVAGVYQLEPPGLGEALSVPRQVVKNLRALIRSGVTTVRDMGAPAKMAVWLRERAARGQVESPRILTPGPVFTAPGGYPTFMEDLPPAVAWVLGRVKIGLQSPDEARRHVDELAELGVDHIKAIYTSEDYDDRRTRLPRLGDAELRALTERAHHHNLPVAVHHVWRKDLGPLLELDCDFDSLEHLTLDAVMEPRHVTRIKERNLPVTTTFMTYGIIDFIDEMSDLLQRQGETLFEPGALARVQDVVYQIRSGHIDMPGFGWNVIETGMKYALENLQCLREAGVRVVVGTDQGGAITPCGQIVWELRSFVRGGCTHLEALQAATSEAAEALGRPELGGLRPGGPADVILVSANPAQDVRALEHVDVVIRDGIVFKNLIGVR